MGQLWQHERVQLERERRGQHEPEQHRARQAAGTEGQEPHHAYVRRHDHRGQTLAGGEGQHHQAEKDQGLPEVLGQHRADHALGDPGRRGDGSQATGEGHGDAEAAEVVKRGLGTLKGLERTLEEVVGRPTTGAFALLRPRSVQEMLSGVIATLRDFGSLLAQTLDFELDR